jgi:hypothetical protein
MAASMVYADVSAMGSGLTDRCHMVSTLMHAESRNTTAFLGQMEGQSYEWDKS